MNLLSPAALWLSITGAGILVLYLLKIRRTRQSVPSLEFWRQLISETQVRSLLQRLKRLLSLLLWLAIAACLVFAVANPVITRGRMKAESIVIIIDNSASMQAVEPSENGKTRFEIAKQAVARIVNGRPVNDEWMVINAAFRPQVVQAFTRRSREVLRAVEDISPHQGACDHQAALVLARQLLKGKPSARIVMISDGDGGQLSKLTADQEDLVVWPIGQADENVGLVQMRVRPVRDDASHHVFLRAINSGPSRVESRIVFTIDDTTVKVTPLEIEPHGEWEETIVFNSEDGGILRATIDIEDGLVTDNSAFAILEPIEPAAVFLVTKQDEAFFFQQALLAMAPLVNVERSLTVTPAEYADLEAEVRRRAHLTVFNNCLPAEAPPGWAVYVNKWPSSIPARPTGSLTNVEVEAAASRHPLNRHMQYGAVRLASATQVNLTSPVDVLARSRDGKPLVFVYRDIDQSSLCLAFDVLNSNLPFRNSFPILLRNTVSATVSNENRWVQPNYQVGENIRSLRPLPDETEEISVTRLVDDELSTTTIKSSRQSFAYADTRTTGPLRFDIGDTSAYACVNLTNERESQLSLPKVSSDAPQLPLSDRPGGMLPWMMLAVMATALVSFEWCSYHLRWTE